MTIRAVLFDKDGTLVDFDATWGPAGLAIMRDLAGPDEAALARLIAVADYDVASLRFRPASPVIAGSTGDYGPSWAARWGGRRTRRSSTRWTACSWSTASSA